MKLQLDEDTFIELDEGLERDTESEASGKAGARQAAIETWKLSARKSTLGQLNQAVHAVQALVVQLRAINGSAADTDLGKRMRLAADFLEDL
jgi:hypothetical protein